MTNLTQKDLEGILSNSDAILARRCRRDFYFFVQEFWETIITEDPVWNWHIEKICNELQEVAFQVIRRDNKQHDYIVNVPPGSSKSSIIMQLFPAWCWIAELPDSQKEQVKKKNRSIDKLTKKGYKSQRVKGKTKGRDLRFICGSATDTLTIDNSDYSRDIIRSEKYQKYFPEIEIRRDKNAKSNYKNTFGGTRVSATVGSTVIGIHAHFILIDDPIDPNKSLSDAERIRANNWTDRTLSMRKVNKRITVTILVMQRLHEDDPTGHMLNLGTKTKHICLPGEDSYEVKPPEWREYYQNGLFDPIRLDHIALEESRKKLGSFGYAGQIGQSPVPVEGGKFSADWFELVDSVPQGITRISCRGWDLAATKSNRKNPEPAYTAGVKIDWVDGIFYISHAKRARKEGFQVREMMKRTAEMDGIGTIQDFPQDPGQAGKDQAQTIAQYLIGFNVRYSVESGDKELRAEPLSAQAEAGNIKIVRGEWNQQYIDEIKLFPNSKFKDQVDATSRAFHRIVKEIPNTSANTIGAPREIMAA